MNRRSFIGALAALVAAPAAALRVKFAPSRARLVTLVMDPDCARYAIFYINRSTYTWWQAKTSTAIEHEQAFTSLTTEMRNVRGACRTGFNKPLWVRV